MRIDKTKMYLVKSDLIQSLPKYRKKGNRIGYRNEYDRYNHISLFCKCNNMFGPVLIKE